MTLAEYCKENNIDLQSILNLVDHKMITYTNGENYHIGNVCIYNKNKKEIKKNQYIDFKDEFYIEFGTKEFFIKTVKIHLYGPSDMKVSTTVYHSFQLALQEFKKLFNLENYSKDAAIQENYQGVSYNELMDLIDKLIVITKEDKTVNIVNDYLNFIEDDLQNVFIKNGFHHYVEKYSDDFLYVKNDLFEFRISNYSYENKGIGSENSQACNDFTKVRITCTLKDEGITLNNTFSNLSELKTILQKIVTLMENNPNYTTLAIDIQNIL